MKIILTILVALLSMADLSAQERFFSFTNGWAGVAGIESDSGYSMFGISNQSSFEHQLQIDRLTSSGALIDGHSFYVDTMLATGTRNSAKQLLQVSDNEYLGVGSMNDDSLFHGLVFRHDLDLQTTEVVLGRRDDRWTQFNGIHEFTDSTYLVSGILSNFGARTRFYCMGYNDSLYWIKDFSSGGLDVLTIPQDITIDSEGNIYALMVEYDLEFANDFEDRERTLLVKMNDSGLEIWRAYPGNYEGYKIRPGGVIEDNGEIVVCYTDPYYYDSTGEWHAFAGNKVRFEKYNSEGLSLLTDSIVEPVYYGPLRVVNQFTKLSDNDYLVAGYHQNGMAMLMKVQPDLDLVWNRRYTPYLYSENPQQQSAMYNVIETSDSGFLCTGTYITYPGGENYPGGFQSGFALKVDNLGCLEEGCHVVGLEESFSPTLKIYPNPNSGDFTIEGLLRDEVYGITILNMLGQVVRQSETNGVQDRIIIKDLREGLYQIRIEGEDFGITTKQVVVAH